MDTIKKTLFISDLHLEDDQPHIARQFLQLLERCDHSVDTLYILGDLFEAWIGDDDNTDFNRHIINALRAATQKGLNIYFLHGNRDFLLGKKFQQETGCKLLPEETKIQVYGTPVLLMHGDILCTEDIAYLKWRKKARNPILNTLLFLIWPLRFRRWFATKMRAQSKQHTQVAAKEIMDVSQAEVERVMKKHHVNYLIHGHTHRLGIHEFSLGTTKATRIVLGAWHDHGSALMWDETGKKELLELSLV